MDHTMSDAVSEGEPINHNRNNSSGERQTPERNRSEGVEGSLRERQVHKRSKQGQSEGADGSLEQRQVRKRSRQGRSEGADGSLQQRQVRKHSYIFNSQRPRREVSQRPESREETRHQNSATLAILSSPNNEGSRRNESLHDRPLRPRPRLRNYKRSRHNRSSSRDLSSSSSENEARATRRRRRRRLPSDSEDDVKYIRRRRCRSRSRGPRFDNVNSSFIDMPSNDKNILNKFLDILSNVKGSSTSKLSLTNVLPEFDPTCKDQTILTWLTKVEECAEIYGWNEREVIHFALPKLTGIAKTWYQGLDTVLYSWSEWKRKLIESFPCKDDYAELLMEMLAKRVRYGESLEHYYYSKINLINRCGIKGGKAVDCLVHGIEDRAIRVGAQAAQFKEPEDVLKYLKTVKPGHSRETAEKSKSERKGQSNTNKFKPPDLSNKIKCHNCNEDGHKSFKCSKSPSKCTFCGREGHLDLYCRTKQNNNANENKQALETKQVKQVALLDNTENSNEKYLIEIEVKGKPLIAYVDLGSQCTLVKESIAKELGLNYNSDKLPILRGIGGYHVQPLGEAQVDMSVQGIEENVGILVVDDSIIKYPVLLGHTFTEKPNITITKTPNQIIFEKLLDSKVFLMAYEDTNLEPNELVAVTVRSPTKCQGTIFVNGSVRGQINKEHYLLPGGYTLENGLGKVLVHNLSSNVLTLRKGSLITRAVPVSPVTRSFDVLPVSFDDNLVKESVHCGEQISANQKNGLLELLAKYSDCFSSGLKDLGFTTMGEMKIELENSDPVVYRPYRLSYGERSQVREMVQEMLDTGIVRESSSPYASPIVLVKKKTGEKRLCVDYRALNRRTKKDHYPLPLIEDQLDRLSGNTLFVSLDLASGYYQIPIEEKSQDKTAFVTPDGQFEFTRMPFGLVNAPSVFQRTINKILSDAKSKYALVYMDDVLVPARSFEEGMSRLEEVLTLLKKGGLTLKLAKCKFFYDSIDFLGFQIGAGGIQPGIRKTDAISKFPVPKTQHELRQFLGLASFFRRFVRGFAIMAGPLTDLLRKDAEWTWGAQQDESFQKLKSVLTTRPVLALYDPKRETQVHTDASKHGVAGILLQKGDDGLLKPVSFFSRKTTPDEQKYHSFELETLAVVSALNRFRVYLIGMPFKVLTDCNALRTTLTKKDLIPRIARWWVQLQEFDCEIEYRPGTRMQHVDALSRNPVEEAVEEHHVLDVLNVGTEDWIATVQSSDSEVVRIKEILTDPDSVKVMDILKNYKLKNGKVYRIMGEGDNDIRWLVPKGVRWQIAKMNHDDVGHFSFEKTLTRIKQAYWFPKMRKFIKKYVGSCLECAYHKGISGKQEGELHPIPKVGIPFHTIHADHLGPFIKSKRGNCYLLVIIDGFTKYINITPVRNTKSNTSIKVFQEHISYFGAPTRIITDQGTSFTSNSFRKFTKSTGIKHILNAVATPRANGQVERFNRTILDALSAKTHGKDDRSWDDYVPDIQIGLNTTIHKTTGKSPSELLFGFKINSGSENVLAEIIDDTRDASSSNLEQIREQASERIIEQQRRDKYRFDSKRKSKHTYAVGDLVSVNREVPSDGRSKKLVNKYQGPYRITKLLPNDRFAIEDTPLTRKPGRPLYDAIVAIDKLKPWLVFNKNYDSSENSDDNAIVSQDDD